MSDSYLYTMENGIQWPKGKKFAFTIIDDTDNSTVENIKPVYDLLEDLNLRTTKTIWTFPPRDHFSGSSIQDPEYLEFLLNLEKKGFEIALHNVGSGEFKREEIQEGLKLFEEHFGHPPKIHVNHSRNPDNIYWGSKRFVPPISSLYGLFSGNRTPFSGEDPNSPYFWGDIHKEKIQYTRNLVFNGINTLSYDSKMPYMNPWKEKHSNYWFSSSDGHTVEEFREMIRPSEVDRLEREGGVSIVYTHFASGFVNEKGIIDPVFRERMEYLSQKEGWFVPAGMLLDHLKKHQRRIHIGHSYLLRLNLKWVMDRLVKKLKQGR